MGCLFEGLLCQQNCSTTKKKLIACTDHYLGKYVLTSKMKILKRLKPLQHFCRWTRAWTTYRVFKMDWIHFKEIFIHWGFDFGAMHFPPYHSYGAGKNTCQPHLLNPSWTLYRTKRTKRSSKDFVVSQNDEGLENSNRFVNKLEAKQFQKLEMNEWKNRNCQKIDQCIITNEGKNSKIARYDIYLVVTGLRWFLLVAKCPP